MRLVAVLLAGVLMAAGCVLPGEDEADEPVDEPTTDTTADGADEGDGGTAADGTEVEIGDVSFVDSARCPFELPAGLTPRCGTVAVPVDWATGEGSIELTVAVYPSTAAEPADDPVVYLEGGPGGHALETARFNADDLLAPLLERGDVIIFDQRGAGLSEPEMGCSEITTLSRELEDNPGQDPDDVDAQFTDALRRCRSRLEGEGVNLGAFNTVNNAHDVEAIRLALGYNEWNLLGISYGTKLALEVMRRHPGGVRTAVIDSVFPQQVDSVRDNPQTFLDSFDAVAAACAAEEACAAQGDLRQRYIDVVQAYDADPVEVEVTDFLAGTTDTVAVEGETLVGVLSQGLYSPFWFTDFPELLTELENGETTAIEAFLSQQRTNEPFFTDGMFYAIQCNEEIPFADPDEVASSVPADPFGLLDTYDYASNNGNSAFDTCEAFGSGRAPAGANDPVVSDVPTLVMAGAYDPVTPVSWAETAAENLANSFLVVAPHDSHGVSPGECGMSIVRQFLDDPAAEPDAACFDDDPVSFLGAPAGVELEPFTFDSGLGAVLSGVAPVGWQQGDLQGDFYRQESLLDNTLLFQLTGNPNLGPLLENYLETVAGITLGEVIRVPGPAGRSWNYRSGVGTGVAAEVYEGEVDGFPVFVMLVANEAERQQQIDQVLTPVLSALQVEAS
ncbi:MAG: alpha/beta fold hydrolase [Actinomycetota bacterium]